MPPLSFRCLRLEPVLRRWLPLVALLPCAAPLAAQDSLPPADTTHLEAPRDSAGQGPFRVIVEKDSLGRPIIQYIEVRGLRHFRFDRSEGFRAPTDERAAHHDADSALCSANSCSRWASRTIPRRRRKPRATFARSGDLSEGAGRQRDHRLGLRAQGVRAGRLVHPAGPPVSQRREARPTGRSRSIELNLLGTATRFITTLPPHPRSQSLVSFQFLQPRLWRGPCPWPPLRDPGRTANGARWRSNGRSSHFRDKAGINDAARHPERAGDSVPRAASRTASDSLRRKYVLGRVEAGQGADPPGATEGISASA